MYTYEDIENLSDQELKAVNLIDQNYDYIYNECSLDKNGKPSQVSVKRIIKNLFRDTKIDLNVLLFKFVRQYEYEEGKLLDYKAFN